MSQSADIFGEQREAERLSVEREQQREQRELRALPVFYTSIIQAFHDRGGLYEEFALG